MRRKWGILIVSLVLCFVILIFGKNIFPQEIANHKVTNIEGYKDVVGLLKSDCWSLEDALPAQRSSVSYIPKVGWLFIIENAGQFNFKKMTTAVQENLISLDLLLAKELIASNTKIFVSFELAFGDDYILVFNAEDLSNTEKWEIYKGEQ